MSNPASNSAISNISRRNGKYIYRYFCTLLLAGLSTVIFLYNWLKFLGRLGQADMLQPGSHSLHGMGNIGMSVGIYFILYLTMGNWLHAFKIGVERTANILAAQVLTLLITDFFEIFISCAVS